MRITERLGLIKLVTLIGVLTSVLCSINLWAGQRWFPKAPLFDFIQGLAAPYDYVNLLVLILLLVLSFFYRSRLPIVLLILFAVYLCIEDQNRLQPWFYNYILIFLVFLFYKKRVDEPNNYISVFISLQLLVALIYIFSGIQKFNSAFVEDSFLWIISPLKNILSDRQIALFSKIGYSIPYAELLIGIGLLFRQLRFIALPLVILMHLFILLMLGPFGKSYNYVVWPWNLVMIVINLLLFANVQRERFFDISILFKSASFYIVITLMFIFPVFSLNNKYDSYLSSSLYSANTHNGKLLLSDNAYEKLPLYIKHFVSTNSNIKTLNIKHWAMSELNVPCVPEYRIFKNVQQYVIRITETSSEEVILEFTEREKILDF